MFKNSLAIAALLNSADAIHIQDMGHKGPRAHSTELSELGSKAGYSFSPSCTTNIDRFTNGDSNSWMAFSNSQRVDKKWEDQDFKADDSSLSWDYSEYGYAGDRYTPPRGMAWKRPTEMEGWDRRFQSEPKLYGNLKKAVPNGVSQNQLGDCWFLAAASSVAEQPERIDRIIWNKAYNKNGAFRFYFWVKNGWYGINIDDRLPVKKSGSKYRPFATWPSTQAAWWMPLLEKAYAKLDVNYDRIVGGWGQEGLRTLTGMPTFNYRFRSYPKADMVKLHKYFGSKNYPMTCGCCRKQGYGLISGHAYSLLDVKAVTDSSGQTHTLAQVRNPWNAEYYNGPWSDKDSRWTSEMKKKLGWENSNDGIFWMEYNDYYDHFENTGISYYDKYAAYEVKEIELAKDKVSTEMSLKNPVAQHFYLTFEQYSNRHYPRAKKCIKAPQTVAGILNSSNQWVNYDWLYGKGFGTTGSVKGELAAGNYQIYIQNSSYKSQGAQMSLNIYSLKQKITVQ